MDFTRCIVVQAIVDNAYWLTETLTWGTEFYDMDLDMIQASSFWGEQHDDIDR